MSLGEESAGSLSVVYLLTNPAMPGLVKIGRTSQEAAQIRLDQLYTTGVPVPFELVFACRVPNPVEVERALHEAFRSQRINPKREFFRIEPEQALAILKLLHVQETTAEITVQPSTISDQEIAAGRELRARRPNLNFVEMGIPIGSTLEFAGEFEAMATVSGPRKVLYSGEETSLTALTKELLGLDYSVAPGPYWSFGGRSLSDIYEDTYSR